MSLHYRIYFHAPGGLAEHFRHVHATDPIKALNVFHARIQLLENKKPDEYSITRMTQVYHELARDMRVDLSRPIESAIDLPRTGNPRIEDNNPAWQDPNQSRFPFDEALGPETEDYHPRP